MGDLGLGEVERSDDGGVCAGNGVRFRDRVGLEFSEAWLKSMILF